MENSKIILSIVVPIYNVEKYLRKCVDSLLNQDLSPSEYEIILVDDGSPDACPQICDEYARMNELVHEGVNELGKPLIKVVHRENGGLSAARNSGIKMAQGKYIMYVDSDDYLEPNVLGALIEQMERDNLDVLRYNYHNVRLRSEGVIELGNEREYEVFEPHKTGKPYFDYSSEVVDGETFLNERLGYACYAWDLVLRRELMDGCLFTEGIYFEDTDWTPRMLMRAKRVASTEMIVYNYLWREGSITLPDNPMKKKKVLEDKIKLLYGFQERRKLVHDPSWFIWQTAGTTMSVLGILATYPATERQPYLRELKSLGIFPLSTYRAVGNNKYKIRMANISPSLYCNIMHVMHRMKE